MKRTLSILLSVCLMLSCLTALADTEATGFCYDAQTNVLTYTGQEAELTLPRSIEDTEVFSTSNCLLDNTAVTRVLVEEGHQSIGYRTFSGCTALADVVLPLTVTEVYGNAFSYCTSLQRIALPKGLRLIGESAFEGCSSLTAVEIPAGVVLIDQYAFADCVSLSTMRFLGHAPYMGYSSVKNLSPDITYVVPDDCVEEYKAALSPTANIQPGGYTAEEYTASATDARLFSFDAATGTITGYTGQYAPVVTVPAQIDGVAVTAIGEDALAHQYYMHMVELPKGVTTVASCAFMDSNLLFVGLPDTLTTIGTDAFNGTKLRTLPLPDSLTTLQEGAFRRMQLNGTLTIPESVTQLPPYAFQEAHMSRLYLPSTLTSVASGAFAGMYRTEYIYLAGESLPAFASDAFATEEDTSTLEGLYGLYLPWNADYETVQQLKAVTEPMGFAQMQIYRFDARDEGLCVYADTQHGATYAGGMLTTYSGDLESVSVWPRYTHRETIGLGEGVFAGNAALRRFYPHHAGWFTTIGAEAFADSGITFVEMFDTITTVGSGAFRNCTGLTEIVLPPLLRDIAPDAFEGCTGITRVDIQCDPAILPAGLFDSLIGLEEVHIRSGEVSAQLFAHNPLAQVTLGEDVTVVGEGALSDLAQSGSSAPTALETPSEPVADPPITEGEDTKSEPYMDMTAYEGYVGLWGNETITLTITEKGLAQIVRDGEEQSQALQEQFGFLLAGDLYLILQGDDSLSVSGGMYAVLYRDGIVPVQPTPTPTPTPTPAPTPTPEPVVDVEAYCGQWYADLLLDGSDAFSPEELELFAIMGDRLEILPDGTLLHDLYGTEETGTWTTREGKLWMDEGSLLIDTNGRLQMTFLDTPHVLLFTRERSAYFSDLYRRAQMVPAKERMEIRYVCIGAEVDGVALDPAQLAGTYTMTFHDNGRMDFTMAGMDVPGGLAWEEALVTDADGQEQIAFVIDLFGEPQQAILTPTGFSWQYMGTSLLHFEPEDASVPAQP